MVSAKLNKLKTGFNQSKHTILNIVCPHLHHGSKQCIISSESKVQMSQSKFTYATQSPQRKIAKPSNIGITSDDVSKPKTQMYHKNITNIKRKQVLQQNHAFCHNIK